MRDLSVVLEDVRGVISFHEGGHFVYTNGDHGWGHVTCSALSTPQHRILLGEVVSHIFMRLLKTARLDPSRPMTVVGPQTVGAAMANELPHTMRGTLPVQLDVRTFKKDPTGSQLVWERTPIGAVDRLHQILWVDDVLNAGSTLRRTKPLIDRCGAYISAAGVIFNRGGLDAGALGVPYLVALEELEGFDRYPEAECPYCARHEPIIRHPGHGHEFERNHPDYPGGYIDL